jgi:hypothetical protein
MVAAFAVSPAPRRDYNSNEPVSSVALVTPGSGFSGSVTQPFTIDSDDESICSQPVSVMNQRIPRKRGRASLNPCSVPVDKLIDDRLFDPLEEEIVDSDSDIEMDNVSGDDSLPGPNEEWLQLSKKGRNGQNRSTSIDVAHPLPRLEYEDIPVMFQGPEDAEKVNRYFVVERRSEPMPGDDKTDVGDTPGIEGFEVWLRGDYGCGLRSALDRCPHYDTNRGGYNRLRRRAKRNQLPFLHIPQGTTTIVNGMHNLFLSNEDQFEDEINDLDLEGIFKDCMVKEHPTDSTKMRIAGRNKRGNRGLSLGFTSGHSLKKDAVTGIAGPQIVIDTWRYVPVAIKFSNLQKMMSKASGFELFDEEQFPDRQFNWAQKIDDEVINELFSLLYLVHDDPKSLAYYDWLKNMLTLRIALTGAFLDSLGRLSSIRQLDATLPES